MEDEHIITMRYLAVRSRRLSVFLSMMELPVQVLEHVLVAFLRVHYFLQEAKTKTFKIQDLVLYISYIIRVIYYLSSKRQPNNIHLKVQLSISGFLSLQRKDGESWFNIRSNIVHKDSSSVYSAAGHIAPWILPPRSSWKAWRWFRSWTSWSSWTRRCSPGCCGWCETRWTCCGCSGSASLSPSTTRWPGLRGSTSSRKGSGARRRARRGASAWPEASAPRWCCIWLGRLWASTWAWRWCWAWGRSRCRRTCFPRPEPERDLRPAAGRSPPRRRTPVFRRGRLHWPAGSSLSSGWGCGWSIQGPRACGPCWGWTAGCGSWSPWEEASEEGASSLQRSSSFLLGQMVSELNDNKEPGHIWNIGSINASSFLCMIRCFKCKAKRNGNANGKWLRERKKGLTLSAWISVLFGIRLLIKE